MSGKYDSGPRPVQQLVALCSHCFNLCIPPSRPLSPSLEWRQGVPAYGSRGYMAEVWIAAKQHHSSSRSSLNTPSALALALWAATLASFRFLARSADKGPLNA